MLSSKAFRKRLTLAFSTKLKHFFPILCPVKTESKSKIKKEINCHLQVLQYLLFLNTQNHVSEQIFHFNCCKAGPKMHGNNHECGLHRSWSVHGPRGPSHVTSSRPLASWLSLPHYNVRLTPADPDTPVKSQQWLPRGAAGLTIHFSTFLFSPLPLSTQIHSTFLSSHVLTRLFFPPSPVTLHPIMWSHDAMTE